MKKNILEWLVFGTSLILVATVIGLLVYDWKANGNEPPNLVVSHGTAQAMGNRYRLPVTVRNIGGMSAEGVMIEGRLKPPGQEEETAEFTVAFVPRGSERKGWLTFPSDPSHGDLSLAVIGYEHP